MGDTIFQNGAIWLRADFHLHTRADREFRYTGDVNYYESLYVDTLQNAGIRVGVVANHNKFAFDEFKALQKTAKRKEIFLLPGVELSVNDGANGIHTLIVFSDEWLQGGQDYINQFLHAAFEGKTPDQYEDGRSSSGLPDTINRLERYNKDFFLINDWLGDAYPAEVEGSDPKRMDEIGRGQPCFLKLGAFTYAAVKFALTDHKNRVSLEIVPQKIHSHIQRIRFEGGTLDGKTVHFSPELNTLIGIRGSGKSSIVEVLRYGLDIPFGEKALDTEYKQKLAGFTLGSGGKVIIDATDRYGQPYQIQRIWKEQANVFIGGQLRPGLTIRETVLHKPVYFGQKDLSNTGEGFEKDLAEKLLGSKLDEIRRRIAEQKDKVTEAIARWSKTRNTDEWIAEQTTQKQDAEYRLEFYKKHGLEEKLQKRLAFDADIRKAKKGVGLALAFASDIRDLLARHEDSLRNFPGHASRYNAGFFKTVDALFAKIILIVENLKTALAESEALYSDLKAESAKLADARSGLADEFAAIERKLAEELKDATGQPISSDDFLELKQKAAKANAALAELVRSKDRKAALHSELCSELQKLNELWREEFQSIKGEFEKFGANGSTLAISVGFKEDKTNFLDYFKNVFKGSGIREATFQGIVDHYQDFIAVFRDWENAKKLFGSNPDTFADIFINNLTALLVHQTPNKFTITYHGKELSQHSLGQRASALILFVLGQKENDVIIIDQPEDDLDNQTIYEDVIKLIQELKPQVQFIFATHNPNIPVLGDAEQIHACSFDGAQIALQSGGLDDPAQQKKIVDIMEGGKEAFERRKEIYQIWKPQNS
jgi:energy-coupling factor transporter ATP-binding protein EcfA2